MIVGNTNYNTINCSASNCTNLNQSDDFGSFDCNHLHLPGFDCNIFPWLGSFVSSIVTPFWPRDVVVGHGSWQVVQKFSGGAGGDGSEGQELAVGAGVGIWLISWRLA